MRKTKHWLMTIAALLCSLAASAHDFEVGGIYYNITSSSDLTVAVTFKGDSSDSYEEYSGDITIPATVTYNGTTYQVTSIGNSAFHSCSNLTRIDVPEGVVAIEGVAMCQCNSLTLITLPSSLIDIDATAFNLSGNIIQFIIDEDNPVYTDYINNAIVEKDSKTLIAGTVYGGVPDSYGYKIEHIGDYAFCGRNIDGHFSVPEGVVSIGECAFAASTITSIRLPKTLKKCEQYVFQHLAIGVRSNISKVYIEDMAAWLDVEFNVESNPLCNGASLYLNNVLLESIVIPEGVTTIKSYAFDGWNGEEIVLPESVTSIEILAFYGCTNLNSITCKALVPPTIERSTFGEVDRSIPVYVPASSVEAYKMAEYWSEFTNIQPKIIANGTYGDNLTWKLTDVGELIIEGIGDMANLSPYGAPWNSYINRITSVTISDGITNIGLYTFSYCSALTTVNLPESVTYIGACAFESCTSLASITLPKNLQLINGQAFYNCSKLASITCEAVTPPACNDNCFDIVNKSIPVYVPASSVNAYKAANHWKEFTNIVGMAVPITHITLSQSSATLLIEESLTLTATVAPDNATDKTLTWSSSNPSVATVDNMGKVTAIASGTVTITATANDGSGVSAQCEVTVTRTAKVEIDGIWYNLISKGKVAEVTSSGGAKYSGSITIPATVTYGGVTYSVTSIGDDAFKVCRSLTAITLPEGVTSIGSSAFNGCRSLTAITLPEGVTSIGDDAFSDCSSLTAITLPESLTSIGSNAFEFCQSLTAINIPEGVTSIGEYTFYYCRSLTAITLPEGVTSIGDYTFSNCSSLTDITIPASVTSIGGYAFMGCSSLTAITLPASVTSIGDGAFGVCTSLTSITCKAVTPPTIGGSYTFYNVSKSIPVYVPAESVDAYKAADYWKEFTNIQTIPTNDIASGTCGDNLTWRLTEDGELIIEGTGAMYDFSSDSAPWYEYRKSIKTVTMKKGITSIGNSAFHSCSNLTRIDVPEGVVAIEGVAMCQCNSLTLITLPSSLIDIDATAFNLSGNIIQFIIDEDNPVYTDYINNAIVEKDSKTLIAGTVYGGVPDSYGYKIEHIGDYAFCGRNIVGNFSIPDGVVSIGRYAFAASTISSIRIPKTLKKCEDRAFQYSFAGYKSDITRVYIDDLSSWLDIDFYGWESNPLCNGASLYLKDELLSSIVIPVGVTTIKRCAFAGWSGKEVLFPESVTSIEILAFYGCTNLNSITCKALVPPTIERSTFGEVDRSIPVYVPTSSVEAYKMAEYWSEFTNIQPIIIANGTCGANLTWELTDAGELIIEGTGDMYDYSSQSAPWYEYRESIKAVTIKEGATSIGDNAFQYCVYPTSITLPESVMSIGKYAFWWCASLASITIPESVTSIGYAAFAYCRRLTTITIPESSQLTLIGRGAFESTLLTSITIPKSVTSIGENVFYSCSSLTTIVVAEGNTTYDSRNNCNAIIETNSNTLIAGCASTVIPEDVTSIDAWAFYNLDNLTTINIPECVTSIGECAFESCSSLTSITCEAITPPMIESTTFQNIDKTIPLYVPAASVAIYKSAQYWNEFTNILPLPITITISKYGSGTYSSEYALDFSEVEGLKAYAATGFDSETGVVTLTRVMTSQPGMGLFIKGEPGEYTVPTLESTSFNTLNMLVGVLEKTTVNSTSNGFVNFKYTIKEGDAEPMFYRYTDGSTCSAGKAYLQIPTAWLPQTTEARSIRFRFDEGEGTTDIEQSTIDNSQLTITYDLYGRRVDNPVKGGIYIVNGKKVIVK